MRKFIQLTEVENTPFKIDVDTIIRFIEYPDHSEIDLINGSKHSIKESLAQVEQKIHDAYSM